MQQSKSIIKKLEYIARLDSDKIGDVHHPLSPTLKEKTQKALLGVNESGTESDRQRYAEALNNPNVQRILGLRKEI